MSWWEAWTYGNSRPKHEPRTLYNVSPGENAWYRSDYSGYKNFVEPNTFKVNRSYHPPPPILPPSPATIVSDLQHAASHVANRVKDYAKSVKPVIPPGFEDAYVTSGKDLKKLVDYTKQSPFLQAAGKAILKEGHKLIGEQVKSIPIARSIYNIATGTYNEYKSNSSTYRPVGRLPVKRKRGFKLPRITRKRTWVRKRDKKRIVMQQLSRIKDDIYNKFYKNKKYHKGHVSYDKNDRLDALLQRHDKEVARIYKENDIKDADVADYVADNARQSYFARKYRKNQ